MKKKVLAALIAAMCFGSAIPASIPMTAAIAAESEAAQTTKDMTADDVIALSKKGKKISWSDFDGFNVKWHSTIAYSKFTKIELGNDLFLVVGGEPNSRPEVVWLCYSSTDNYVDVKTGDVQAFISKNTKAIATTTAPVTTTVATTTTAAAKTTTAVTTISTEIPDVQKFTAVVLSVSETTLLLKPVKDSPLLNLSDRFTMGKNQMNNDITPTVGMKLEITHSGSFLTTYPERIGKVENVSVVSEAPEITTGDANCDDQMDMSDVVLIMQALANPNKYGENGTALNHLTGLGRLNADMDGDGLTVGDAQAIQMKLLGFTENEAPVIKLNTLIPKQGTEYVELKPDEPMVSCYDPVLNSLDGVGVWFELSSPVTLTADKGSFKVFTYKNGGLGTVDEVGKSYKLDKSGEISWVPEILTIPDDYEEKIHITDSKNADLGTLVITKNPKSGEGVFCVTLKKAGSSESIDRYLTANAGFLYESGSYTIFFLGDGKYFCRRGGSSADKADNGTYTISGDTVVLTGQFGKNSFRYENNTLIYIAEGSDGFSDVKPKDGEKFYAVLESSGNTGTLPALSDILTIKTDYNPVMSDWSGIGILLEFDSPEYDITLEAGDGQFVEWDTIKGSGPVKNEGKTYEIGKSGSIFWDPDDMCYTDSFVAEITVKGTNGGKQVELGKIYITHNDRLVFTASLEKPESSDSEVHSSADYPCAIRVNGTVFWQTDEKFSEDFSKYTVKKVTAYSENGTPQNDGESNFDRKCTTEYIILDEKTIVVNLQDGLVGYWIFKAK